MRHALSAPPVVPPTWQAWTPSYRGGEPIKQLRKSWTGMSASLTEVRCDGSLHVDLGARATRLSVVLEQVGGRFDIRAKSCQDASPSPHAACPLGLVPGGFDAHGRASGIRFMRHLVIAFDVSTLARMLEGEIDLIDAVAPPLMFSDPGIMRLAQLVAEECARDAPHARLYGDNLSMALVLALSRLRTSERPSIRQGQLAPWRLRRATEYLAAHLAEDIRLQTVCELVKLSRAHFSRAFKISTGLAPHQWLLQARIARAKELLLKTDRPLAQIAVDVGFADQSHFTRTFGRAVGESPGAWQRARSAWSTRAPRAETALALA
jgi:AraC-like DNA-binding protein